MKKLAAAIVFVGMFMFLNAQKFDWVSFTPLITGNSNGGSGGISNTVDGQGNIFTVAVFNDPIKVGNDTLYHVGNLNRPDILITKWNPQGEVVGYRHIANWSGNGNPDPMGMMYDAVHDEILLTISSYYFGMQITLLSNGVEPDNLLTLAQGAVLRFKPDLSFVSKKNLPGGTSYVTSSVVKDGYLYATQGYSSTVSKTDTAGNVLWSVTPTISSLDIRDISITNTDTILVIGYMNSSTVALGGKTVTAPSNGNLNHVAVFKLDTAGNVVQGIYLTQASYYIFPLRLETDLDGNVFVATTYEIPQLAIGNLTLSITPDGRDVFVAKLSPSLVPLWVKEFSSGGDNVANEIVIHPSGKVTLLGTYGGSPTIHGFQMAFAQYGSAYLAQIDNVTGNVSYVTNFGPLSAGTGSAGGTSIVGNKYYISGSSYGSNLNAPQWTASYGCFNQTRSRQFLTCFNDTTQPLPQTNFAFIREQNKVYFTTSILSGNFVSIDFGDGTSTTTQVNPTHTYGKGFYHAVLTSRYDCFERKDTVTILFKGIDKVVPNPIANNHLQIIYVKGGFPFSGTSGLHVILKKGSTVLNADAIAIHDSGTIQANYFLSNEQLGFYDVIVNGPGGFTDTLFNGLEMVPENDVPLSVQVIVNDRRLINRYERVKVMVTNASNINKFAVPVTIALHSGSEIGQLTNKVITDSVGNAIRAAAFVHDFIMSRDSITGDSVWLASLVLPMVGANSSEMIEFFVRGTTTGKKPIAAIVEKPLFADSQLVALGLRTSCDFLPCKVQFGLNGLNMVPVVSCVTNALSLGCAVGNIVNDVIGTRNSQGSITGYAMDVFNPISDVTGILTCSGGGAVKKVAEKVADNLFRQVLDYTFTAAAVGLSAVSPNVQPGVNPDSCFPPTGEDEDEESVEDVASTDPNDKKGYMGYTTENYFNGQKTLHYKIRFENLSTATAPAQHVAIYDTLDANFFDLSTLHFTGFGFADSAYQILNATDSYAQEMDLRPAKNTIVRFEAKLDVPSHSIIWKFDSYDPITRGEVANISDGFLNPNITTPEGQGFVTFSIMPKANRPHLQQVSNVAKIVFDENAPILSDAWINTVDKVKPNSQMQTLPATINDTMFTISWTGSDAHAGIRGYDVFVIENDTATSILLRNTIVTSAIFHGKFGSTYKFYSIATDHAGNREDAAANPDAVITLQQSPISIPIVSELEFSIYPNPAQNQLTLQTNTTEQVSVELIDLQGRVVKRDDVWSKKSMDVSTLSNGVYQVKFTSPQGVVVKRFLKE